MPDPNDPPAAGKGHSHDEKDRAANPRVGSPTPTSTDEPLDEVLRAVRAMEVQLRCLCDLLEPLSRALGRIVEQTARTGSSSAPSGPAAPDNQLDEAPGVPAPARAAGGAWGKGVRWLFTPTNLVTLLYFVGFLVALVLYYFFERKDGE